MLIRFLNRIPDRCEGILHLRVARPFLVALFSVFDSLSFQYFGFEVVVLFVNDLIGDIFGIKLFLFFSQVHLDFVQLLD